MFFGTELKHRLADYIHQKVQLEFKEGRTSEGEAKSRTVEILDKYRRRIKMYWTDHKIRKLTNAPTVHNQLATKIL